MPSIFGIYPHELECIPCLEERIFESDDRIYKDYVARCHCGNIVGIDFASKVENFKYNRLDNYCSKCGVRIRKR